MDDRDILDFTPPAHIPGALFGAVVEVIYGAYPISKRKAQTVSVAVLETMMNFYEAVAKEEDL